MCWCRGAATGVSRPWRAVYAATHPSLLSAATNPFFFAGSAGDGVGSLHVGWNYAWPMAITVTSPPPHAKLSENAYYNNRFAHVFGQMRKDCHTDS